ncbi:MAG: GNAT family N-acetyltransferase [Spirochaetia bacterium]
MRLMKAQEYYKALPLLQEARINTLFAQSVAIGNVSGKIYCNDKQEPDVFYIHHPYGMTLLIGNTEDGSFNSSLKPYLLGKSVERNRKELMQVWPLFWEEVLNTLLGPEVIKPDTKALGDETGPVSSVLQYERVNFRFSHEQYLKTKENLDYANIDIRPLVLEDFDMIDGSVVPKKFWDSKEDFDKKASGVCLWKDGQIASTAFASYMVDNYLEIGIETHPEYRGRGYASLVSSGLIDYAMEKRLEPVWSCHSENAGSQRLAARLGFIQERRIPYYELPFSV